MNNNEVTRKKVGRYLIVIEIDNFGDESPREWDNLGTMACWHRRYSLGDKQPKETPREYMQSLVSQYWKDIETHNQAFQIWRKENREPEDYDDVDTWLDELGEVAIDSLFDVYYISLPLYLYDHSGITMNTSGFSCPWDSGQVGFIYVTRADARKEYGDEYDEVKILQYLEGEVQTYDAYLRGEIYGYLVYKIPLELLDEDEDDLDINDLEWQDSCWGFYPVLNNHLMKSTPAYLHALQEAERCVSYCQKEDGNIDWTKVSTTGLEE